MKKLTYSAFGFFLAALIISSGCVPAPVKADVDYGEYRRK
jgi:hypothetical protein